MGMSLPRLSGRPGVPWWVSVFTDAGRPLAAVVVLVLCAPGEQHLAELAGWRGWLSWCMAGLFSMYAGIAAVVATVRPKDAPGKMSAVIGAVVSLLMAMAAQPVSHLFVTGWVSAEPRPPVWLVVPVSCVPPFILGHLLHLAASPVRPAEDVPDTLVADTPARPVPVPQKPRPVRPRTAAVPSLADRQKLSVRAHEMAADGMDKDTIKEKLRNEFPSAKADSIRKAAGRATEARPLSPRDQEDTRT